MIAYFDTSAVVPLLIEEESTERCDRLWTESTRVVSVRLLYPEARAAMARARRMGRFTPSQLDAAILELDSLMDQIDIVELGPEVARSAGELAQEHGLRGFDAVHLAAALAVADDDFVLVTGDRDLFEAATTAGLASVLTTA